MKRYNNLLANIMDLDNLYVAYTKARKGKEAKAEVITFAENLHDNISKLQGMIAAGRNEEFEYRRFIIHDPKEREICAAPFSQRVLHHALMNVCGYYLDKRQVFDSYACRTGKGTYAALDRAMNMHRKFNWCVKMDIRKFFDSIDHIVLKRLLASVFKEEELITLFFDIIDSYETAPQKGLPIGNLTSQYFANHYLCTFDHYAKETLKVKGMVRYMDDVLIYGDDKNTLLCQAKQLRDYLNKYLCLNLKVMDVRKTTQTMPFLGYRLKRNVMLLGERSKRRYIERNIQYAANYDKGIWTEDEYRKHLCPMIAFAMKARCLTFRKNVLKKTEKKRNVFVREVLTA